MPDLRASDADRERSVAALRHHATAGRLTVDELDERTERAYASTTLRELAELHADLPSLATRPAPTPRRRRPVLPGRRAFSARWHAPMGAQPTMAELIARMTPALSRYGYGLIGRGDGRLRFERELRPPWTFAVAILLFPFGLLALLHKDCDRITIDLDDDEHGTNLVANGVAPLRVRRAFVELED